jgi:hypothetical protein
MAVPSSNDQFPSAPQYFGTLASRGGGPLGLWLDCGIQRAGAIGGAGHGDLGQHLAIGGSNTGNVRPSMAGTCSPPTHSPVGTDAMTVSLSGISSSPSRMITEWTVLWCASRRGSGGGLR